MSLAGNKIRSTLTRLCRAYNAELLSNRRRLTSRSADLQGTVYEGHTYAISLRFPPEYPYKAPTVRFE